jgi:hypothetical protein
MTLILYPAREVRSWPKADMFIALPNVCFGGKPKHQPTLNLGPEDSRQLLFGIICWRPVLSLTIIGRSDQIPILRMAGKWVLW